MASYKFESFSVLVVEDNSFMRLLLGNILRSLGFGSVQTAADGGDAMDCLRVVNEAKKNGSGRPFDMIFSDMIMAPVDGLELLKWVRWSNESPDRMVPFIMVSGLVTAKSLAQARDLGVTEFLAKPFTVNSIVDHLKVVIERPRPFIATDNYFGPDRRRRKVAFDGPEKRVAESGDLREIWEGEDGSVASRVAPTVDVKPNASDK